MTDRGRSRGPSKEGKTSITLQLTADEYARLKMAAEHDFRSATQQARWLVVEALKRTEDSK